MKILLVDDHKLFSSGMKNLLEVGGYVVAGTVSLCQCGNCNRI
jgi:DNA-binding NarL/FixJ family response regulator